MNKKVFVAVMGIALAFAMAGGLVASNMGFKLNYPLAAGDGGATSNSGTNLLALPFNRQSNVDSASQLINDIGLANVANVQKWLEATDSVQTYTGRKGTPGADFGLEAGAGYFVQMNNSVDYIVVGSHDPAFAVSLDAGDGGVTSNSGTNLLAVPYHATASTAKELMDDIGFASVANVQKWLEASDSVQTYTGRKGTPGADFTLVTGEAYFVQMNSTVSYTPSHF